MVAVILMMACVPRVYTPDLAGPGGDPAWPSPPDVARVRYVGDVRPRAGRFARPIDVACDSGHLLAVADPDASVVWVIDAAADKAFLVADPAGARWKSPVGVSFDGVGGLLIVDADRATVSRVRADRRGAVTDLIGEGRLMRPTAAVQRPDGAVYVVDAAAHQVVRMDPDGNVTPITVGRGGAGEGLNFPVDLAFGVHGEAWVADAMNAALDRIDADGRAVLVAGGQNPKVGRLVRPKGVAVDAHGDVHVVDGAMQHVEVYSEEGQLLGRYGEPGAGPGQLGLPAGICIDGDGHIFIADSLNGRVAVFRMQEPS